MKILTHMTSSRSNISCILFLWWSLCGHIFCNLGSFYVKIQIIKELKNLHNYYERDWDRSIKYMFVKLINYINFYRCWMNEGKYNIILQIPVCLTVFLNVIFLFNILRVLLIKLKRGPQVGNSGTSRTSLQALRYVSRKFALVIWKTRCRK